MEIIRPTIILDELRADYLVPLPLEMYGLAEDGPFPGRLSSVAAVYGVPRPAARWEGDTAYIYRFLGIRVG